MGRAHHANRTCNTHVLGPLACLIGSELQPPALRFAPVLCCRVFLMYRVSVLVAYIRNIIPTGAPLSRRRPWPIGVGRSPVGLTPSPCSYSPECVEREFSEVDLLTDSCWIHRCWLGCERGRALSRGSFPFPSGCSLPLPFFVHPRRTRVLRTSS